jgi:hypothetical protein
MSGEAAGRDVVGAARGFEALHHRHQPPRFIPATPSENCAVGIGLELG